MKIHFFNRILLTGLISLSACTVRAAEEKELIAILQSSAGATEKCAACQQLRIYGTAQSVPALAALLREERVGHAARHALEGIPSPEAGAALRKALATTSGLTKAGIVNSLGWRRDTASVPLLVPLISDTDTAIATAAASALGRIGSDKAVAVLKGARENLNHAIRRAVLEALLRCAEDLLSTGNYVGAAALYGDLFHANVPPTIRTAAWRGLVLSDDNQRPELVVKALIGNDEQLRLVALKLVREIKDEQLVKACLQQWNSLPALAQLAVLDAHLQFGTEALATVRTASKSPHMVVRVAAWQALADLSDTSMIPALASAAAEGEPAERDAARDTLARVHGPGVREALLVYLKQAEARKKAELLLAMGKRGDTAAAPMLLQYANASEETIRLAALESLRRLAVTDTLLPLLDLIVTSKSASDRKAVLRALYAVCQASLDKDRTSRQVIAASNRLPASERRYVLPLLLELATPSALTEILKSAQHSDAQLVRESIRLLTQWPDAAPAEKLFEMARTNSDPSLRTLALRGGINVVGREPDPFTRLVLIREALSLASRTEEKKLVLSQLSRIPRAEALEMSLRYLDDPDLINEAGFAAVSIAESLADANPQLANEASRKVLEHCKTPAIVRRAWALRVKPATGGPFIRDWLVCGPYRQAGAIGAITVFNLVFGPEKPGELVQWYAAPVGDTINLAGFFPDQTNCVAYLKAEIIAPGATDAILLMGSDDGIKAWLNGNEVHSNNVDRGQVVDQDIAPIKLNKGSNELLLKITQGGGGWSACTRVVGPDGLLPIKGLRVKSQTSKAPPVSTYKPAPVIKVVPKPAKLPPRDVFRVLHLFDQFYAEGAYYGDFNRDGKLDVVAGPFWFEGPVFQQSHEYRPAKAFDSKGYSDNFLTFAGDFNGDGWTDVLCVPMPGNEGFWYANPARKQERWKRHLAYPSIGNESPVWGDITGDGRPELLFCIDGYLGYAGPDLTQPNQPWVFHAISTKDKRYHRFTHGVGFGDINGDGRNDVVEAVGWWEQPTDIKSGQPWTFHPFIFAKAPAQMLVNDVDGDGLMDIITVWHCHHYGLVWWKQIKQANGSTDWKQHAILSPRPDVSTTDFRVSQLHALKLIDMNNDGLKDILTGKRFWAHGPTGDKEPDAPAIVFWLELSHDGKGNVTFIPHLIDDDSGVGTQVAASDLNDDRHPDVIVANKKGIFLHLSGLEE